MPSLFPLFRCNVCGGQFSLEADGALPEHELPGWTKAKRCSGSGTKDCEEVKTKRKGDRK